MRRFALLLPLVLFACSSNVDSAAAAVNNAYDEACECPSIRNSSYCNDARNRYSDEEIDCVETVLTDFPEIDFECEEQAALRGSGSASEYARWA